MRGVGLDEAAFWEGAGGRCGAGRRVVEPDGAVCAAGEDISAGGGGVCEGVDWACVCALAICFVHGRTTIHQVRVRAPSIRTRLAY